jgi:hypothetical protein
VHRLEFRFAAADEDHRGAVLRTRERHRAPEPGVCAGDGDHAPGELISSRTVGARIERLGQGRSSP